MKHVNTENSTTKLTNVQEGDVQPNAVDIRLDKILVLRPKTFVISEDVKIHRGSAELTPDADGWFTLQEGVYEVIAENQISVGENEAGYVITRSTLNRNGVYITSGLYDSGYQGVIAAALHVTSGPMKIKRGTRIGQYVSFDAEMKHAYAGSYGFGTEDDKKYGPASEPTTEVAPVITRKAGRTKKVESRDGN